MSATIYTERGLNTSLTNAEKRELSRQARDAWQYLTRNGATDEKETEFRHRLSLQACGRRVSEAVRGDYLKISAAFLAITGKTSGAFRSALRDETEGKNIAERKLRLWCEENGKDVSYAGALFKSIHKTTLAEASTRQVWAVYYELNGGNKARAGRRKKWKAKS